MSRSCDFVLVVVAAVAAGVVALVPPAGADEIPYPPEFIGIWEINSVTRDCVTQDIIAQNTERDTVCAGDTYDPDIAGGFPLTCTGTITETTISVECTAQIEVFPGCNASYEITTNGTRNGDTWNTTTTVRVSYIGECGPIEDSCLVTASSATRIDSDPDSCPPSPVEPASWGRIKSAY